MPGDFSEKLKADIQARGRASAATAQRELDTAREQHRDRKRRLQTAIAFMGPLLDEAATALTENNYEVSVEALYTRFDGDKEQTGHRMTIKEPSQNRTQVCTIDYAANRLSTPTGAESGTSVASIKNAEDAENLVRRLLSDCKII